MPRRLLSLAPEHETRAGRDVLQRRHVREQIEALEDHADLLTLPRQGDLSDPLRPTGRGGVADLRVLDRDRARGDRFEHVDAAQQGALARAARPDERHRLPLPDGKRNALQRRIGAVGLDDPVEPQEAVPGGC
jgi:hypothetical protein